MRTTNLVLLCSLLFASISLLSGQPVAGQQDMQYGRPSERALSVGISEYEYGSLSSAFVDRSVDALSVGEILESRGYKTRTLVGRVFREEIVRSLSVLAQESREEDSVIVYLSGQCVRSAATGRAYLLASDTRLEELEVAAIRLDHLFDYVADIPAHRKLLIFDAAFAGEVIPKVHSLEESDERRARQLFQNVVPAEERIMVPDARRPGVAVLLIHTPPTLVEEDVASGILARAVVGAFEGGESDRDRDGHLSLGELIDFSTAEAERRGQEVGLHLELVAIADSPDLSEWRLGQAHSRRLDAREHLEDYADTLLKWRSRAWISYRTYFSTLTVLESWVESEEAGRPLGADQQAKLEQIREFLSMAGAKKLNELSARSLEEFMSGKKE